MFLHKKKGFDNRSLFDFVSLFEQHILLTASSFWPSTLHQMAAQMGSFVD
jgi:hypothetical protein